MNAMRKVLVVDDDPVIGKSFDRVLTGKGYVVVHAANGDEALRRLAGEEYDVMVTDIRMPGIDGVEVAERSRKNQPWMPVVIITGYGSDDNEARAKAAGVHAFLRKPLSPDMIESSLRKAIAEAPRPTAEAAPAVEEAYERGGVGTFLKNLVLFFAAPFIGLAYVLTFPFIGFGTLAWAAAKAWRSRPDSP